MSFTMMADKLKLGIMVILGLSFLTYSFQLYVDSPKEKGETVEYDSELAAKGKLLWQDKNCTSCHQIYGLGGHLGPDLTNVHSKQSEAYIESFLKAGTQVMPNFNLSQEEIDAFKAFFAAIDQSGKSDPRTFNLHLDGTISQ